MRIAVLGTGLMGAPIARNLAAAGHEVRAWNRSRAKAEALAEHGVAVADLPQAAVAGADAVITMLADGHAVTAVAEDALPACNPEVAWLQMSTVGIAATELLAELADKHDAEFVDAPVLGTRQPAEAGQLTVLASGAPHMHDRCAPIFEAVAARVLWLGEAGAGTRMKLVVNSWLLVLTEGLAESIALAERIGVDPAAFLEILDGAPMGAPYAQLKGKLMIARDFPPSFPLALAAKDARLALDAAAAAGLELPALRAVRDQMERAAAAGHGGEDMAATIRATEE